MDPQALLPLPHVILTTRQQDHQPEPNVTDTVRGDVQPHDTKDPAGSGAEATTDRMPLNDPNDLMHSIKGMYRILDLISETGSGGLGMVHSSVLIYHLPNYIQQWRRSSSTKNH